MSLCVAGSAAEHEIPARRPLPTGVRRRETGRLFLGILLLPASTRFSVCPKRPVNLSYSRAWFNGFFCVFGGFSVLTLWSSCHGGFTPPSSSAAPACGGSCGQGLERFLNSAAFAKEPARLGRRVQKAVDAGTNPLRRIGRFSPPQRRAAARLISTMPAATRPAGPRIAGDRVSPKKAAPRRIASTGVRKEKAATVEGG